MDNWFKLKKESKMVRNFLENKNKLRVSELFSTNQINI